MKHTQLLIATKIQDALDITVGRFMNSYEICEFDCCRLVIAERLPPKISGRQFQSEDKAPALTSTLIIGQILRWLGDKLELYHAVGQCIRSSLIHWPI